MFKMSLLRSGRMRIMALLVVPLLFVGLVLPVSVGAVAVDYNDLPHTITVDGANDIVTVTLDPSKGGWSYWGPVSGSASGGSVIFPESTSNWQAQYNFFDYGAGLDPTNIPDDTIVSVSLSYKWYEQVDQGSSNPTYVLWLRSYNTSYNSVGQTKGNTTVGTANNDIVRLSCAYDAMPGASYLVPIVEVYGFSTDRQMTVEVVKCTLTMSISSLYRQQQLTGKTNALLTEVSQQLEANGQKLDDVLAQQQANGEKLDGVNDKLDGNGEKLDQIVQHPEQEKNEANSTGNDTASQITGAIPDKSADFSKAIKDFTASLAYDGLEAKLQLPEVRMPQIDGLLPSFVFMESKQLDFGEYMGLIPENLLLLVQSLLTVALIIFCFKELYDTIQYVLTLGKGGKE